MEPIKEEGSRLALEPFPDHDVIPDFHIVDGSPASMAEKTRPKKKLRFQRNRGSVDSEMSEMGHSVFTEPERPAAYPPKWRMGMLDESAIGGIPGECHRATSIDRAAYLQTQVQSPWSTKMPNGTSHVEYPHPRFPHIYPASVASQDRDG